MKLIRESNDFDWSDDGFDWAREIEVQTDLTPAQIYSRYGVLPLEVVGHYIAGQFNDIYYEGGQLILRTGDWSDFYVLFRDTDSSYGRIGQGLAKLVLAEDDYWEPYYDVVQNWLDDVWDLVTEDSELVEYIKKHIKKGGYIGEPVYSEEKLTEEMLDDISLLGELINDEEMFHDLKMELDRAYENSYNTAARDNIWKAVYEAIKDEFGNSQWITTKNSRGFDVNLLEFNVTKPLLRSVSYDIEDCLDYCKRYFDEEKHYDPEEHNSVEESFEGYCEECMDKPFTDWGDFVNFYGYYLDQTNEPLYPSYDEWPSNSEIKEYFKDDVYSRF
jgi:hypothetical protein